MRHKDIRKISIKIYDIEINDFKKDLIFSDSDIEEAINQALSDLKESKQLENAEEL